MSENSVPEERTEMPTDRRMTQIRKEGQMYLSSDLVQLASLTSGFIMLSMVVSSMFDAMKKVMRATFAEISSGDPLSYQMLERLTFSTMGKVTPDLILIVLATACVSGLAVMLQTNWNVKEKKIHFRMHFLNPIAGLKRIVSIYGVVNTLKALAKLALILPLAYFALRNFAPEMISLIHLNIPQVLNYTGDHISVLFWRIFYVLFVLAVLDFVWGRFQWLKTNKMTKAEVKDERKAVEGDEETKKRIQQKGFQRILQRLRTTVPKADVVVTNPTHFAVALQYDRNRMGAPVVVAKGADFLAQRIKQLAKESGVPVLERKTLARALYDSTEVGAEIPRALFRAVAEVLAYVYRIKKPKGVAPAIAAQPAPAPTGA